MPSEEHLKLHRELISKTLHSAEGKQKSRAAHQRPEYKQKISKIMSTPEMKELLSERAKRQWQNEEYKQYMAKKCKEFYETNEEYRGYILKRLSDAQKEYWSKKENRGLQADRVREFFKNNPEAREYLRMKAKQEWDSTELRKWRSQRTKRQWTEEFR